MRVSSASAVAGSARIANAAITRARVLLIEASVPGGADAGALATVPPPGPGKQGSGTRWRRFAYAFTRLRPRAALPIRRSPGAPRRPAGPHRDGTRPAAPRAPGRGR